MPASSPLWNQNARSCVALADTFCKETASCLTHTAHRPGPIPRPQGRATSALSSVVLSSRWLCCCGSSLATNRQPGRTTATRPTLSRLKPLLRPSLPQPQPRLLPLHQSRLIPSRPFRLTRLPLLRAIPSRLLRLTQRPRLQPLRLIRNVASLRACADLSTLGGHQAVAALFSCAQMAPARAPKLPTGMTLC